jgi:peptidoglycan/xylan/chitin deacetylase (PgdA/CDA1 family)
MTTKTMPPLTGQPFLAGATKGEAELVAVVYHYVRDPKTSRFPGINGMTPFEFRNQIAQLRRCYEMATLESAIAFLEGRYTPRRSLCLLTFDDGLKEHAHEVMDILTTTGVHGVFFVTTGCLDGAVAAVHKNHHLMAWLGFENYRDAVMRQLDQLPQPLATPDPVRAALAYPWDQPDVAAFKYLLNYALPEEWRTGIVNELFAAHLGGEHAFAREIYLNSDEARQMQRAGMSIGGHSHRHVPLPQLTACGQKNDAEHCARRLRATLDEQPHWAFSYPYGVSNDDSRRALAAAGFDSGFALDGGSNRVGQDAYFIRRVDTKDLAF